MVPGAQSWLFVIHIWKILDLNYNRKIGLNIKITFICLLMIQRALHHFKFFIAYCYISLNKWQMQNFQIHLHACSSYECYTFIPLFLSLLTESLRYSLHFDIAINLIPGFINISFIFKLDIFQILSIIQFCPLMQYCQHLSYNSCKIMSSYIENHSRTSKHIKTNKFRLLNIKVT